CAEANQCTILHGPVLYFAGFVKSVPPGKCLSVEKAYPLTRRFCLNGCGSRVRITVCRTGIFAVSTAGNYRCNEGQEYHPVHFTCHRSYILVVQKYRFSCLSRGSGSFKYPNHRNVIG